jgi:hypothetical protein
MTLAPILFFALTHRSSWNRNSANFVLFARPCAEATGDQKLPLDRRNVISGISASDGRRPRTL